ncbi:MAG: peptide chain release factor N(5)-glutamine methyltransferase [Thermaurantiacus tibetensis]
MRTSLPTIGDALYQSSRQLLDAGIDSGSLEASLLLGRATGFDRLGLITRTGEALTEAHWEAFQALLDRRLKREPLQYILGETEFMGLRFAVDPAVLIPRSDTEILIEVILDMEEERGEPAPVTVADIGTGSGAIAVVLAQFLPYMRVVAVDLSAAALEVAKANAAAHEVLDRIDFRLGDGLGALDEPVDYLLSNPPYIEAAEVETLQPEVRDFEPRMALTPGADALHWYRAFAVDGARYVKPGGVLAVEVGAGQAEAVVALLEEAGHWEALAVHPDLGRIDRVVVARRKAG